MGLERAAAFEVPLPPVTVANPGGYAQPLKLDTDRYRQEQADKRKQGAARSSSSHPSASSSRQTCSADALPAADRKRMETEYARRMKTSGKASADAYVQRQGRLYRQKLEAEGICPSRSGQRANTAQQAHRTVPKSGSGNTVKANQRAAKDCRMVMRPIANLSGGAMSMGMVQECN